MKPSQPWALFARAARCWNWKCALLSATMRSLVYAAAMARGSQHGRLAVVLVEVAYVTLTAGLYAGLQQKALNVRPAMLGNGFVVLGIPGLAQAMDWAAHRAAGAPAPGRATFAVCVFTAISALFHLYVMRRGAFLTGGRGSSLATDFRRMPQLVAGFVARPFLLFAAAPSRRYEPGSA